MAFRKTKKNGSSTGLVLAGSEDSRRVSLTGYTNVVLDESKTSIAEEERPKLRVRFVTMPSVELDMAVTGNNNLGRKYSIALQTLKPFRPSSKDGTLPINRTGLFSYIFATWFSGLVWRMFRKRHEPVGESDIWQCSEEEGVRVNTERLERLWQEEVGRRGKQKAAFYNVWLKFIRTRVMTTLVMITVMAVATFLSSAYLVNIILAYLESPDDNILYGLGLVAAVAACEVVRACAFTSLMIFGAQTGTRFRSGMNGVIYDKMLKIRSLKGKTNSEILNAFSVDSYRVYIASLTISFLLAVPVYLIIGTVYCYILIGYWCFVAIGTFVVCYFLQVSLTRVLQKLRRQCVQFTDARVRCIGEILNSMKFIKMYAWEQPFKDEIEVVRRQEQKYLLYTAIVNAITGSIIPVTPTVASVITIAVYTAVGNQLTAPTAFAVIGTMNFLRIIVALIPFAMSSYGEAKVSLERVTRILSQDEYVAPSPDCFDESNAVEIKAANFAWDIMPDAATESQAKDKEKKMKRKGSVSSIASSRRESFNPFVLTNISLEVKEGQLLGLCGAVGSGKSSLISAILGRMMHLKGHLAVSGSIAYVAQQAWIFNGTVKENILFGLDFNEHRYREVISCCGLETDLELFDDGDETEIGERGSNLSGGQKQRVNLARAAYSNSDIYILDDPMSALDVRVGKHIFHSCIRGLLKNKTILLATHQLQYLKQCDEVVVLEDGQVAERGQHDHLLKEDGVYSEMYRIYDNTTMKAQSTNDQSKEGSTKTETDTRKVPKKVSQNGVSNGVAKGTKGVLKKKKGKLVQAEETTVGTIGFSTYSAYIKAAGGWLVAVVVLSLHVLAACSLVFSDWWLSQWLTTLSDQQRDTSFNETSWNMSDVSQHDITTEAMTTEEQNGSGLSSLGDSTYLLVYIVSLAGIMLLQVMKGCAGAKGAITASSNLHRKCLDKVMKAPMSFFDSNPAGRILNRFSKDLDEGDVFIPQVTNSLLQILCLVLLSFAMASYITPWILIAIVPIIFVFYLMKAISTVSIRQLKRLENVVRSPLISHINVTSQGLPTITAYGQQDTFYEKCVSLGDVASMAIFLFDVSMRWIGIRLDLVAGCMTVGSSLIFVLTKGLIPAASAGLVLSLCGKTVSIVQFLVRLMNEVEARFTSIERLNEYNKSLESEAQQGSQSVDDSWPKDGAVEFRNVVMRYRPEMDPVLRSVSFVIQPREKIGVVGRTGAGKSSLAVCLFRLVELSEGSILIDGQDISKIQLSHLRSRISTIPQDPVLFNGTIRYNIDPFTKYTDDEIWEALEKVHMKEKILQFDDSLDVMVDENGENFSVGERQLICLGRAVLRSSKVLLLDEATANIDTSTDAMIQETIRTCFAECTVITIAHRLNTVLHSDKIIVMDAGQVMECASPQDLLVDQNSFFNKMIAAQTVKTPTVEPFFPV